MSWRKKKNEKKREARESQRTHEKKKSDVNCVV